MADSALNKFQSLLKNLFLYDSADLDFGIYRILNARRKEIEGFVDTRLPQIVADAFAQAVASDSQQLTERRDSLREQLRRSLPAIALDDSGEFKPEFLDSDTGRAYAEVQRQLSEMHVNDELITRVYSDLFTFFNRYWDDGDFISARRRGRGETYAVPYNGEEVLLHWANRDQYYIKTGERFTTYRFTVEGTSVSVEIKGASVATNNNKTQKRYFALADDAPVVYEADKGLLTLSLVFRPLNTEEAEQYGKTENAKPQEKLNDAMEQAVLAEIADTTLKTALQAPADGNGVSRLRKRLGTYTRKNSSDFFIHKDLKGFLRRELDFFLKNDVLRLDELLHESATDPTPHLRRARATQQVAENVIDFLAQVENFQKRLFLKKKFVVATHYAVTLHYIPNDLLPAVLANSGQIAEWESLYAISETLAKEGLLNGGLNEGIKDQFPALIVDTRHFDADFRARLLASIDDLDARTDGVLFQSENFQALRLMAATYQECVKSIYIDPPYNTDSAPILYKNDYKHAAWASLMVDRLHAAKSFLPEAGRMCVAIDDTEMVILSFLLEEIFPEFRLTKVTVVHNPKGSITKDFNRVHEYALFLTSEADKNAIGRTLEENEQARRIRRWGANSLRTERKQSFYPIYVKDLKITRIGRVPADDFRPAGRNVQTTSGEIEIWPIDQDGVERRWNFGLDTIKDNLDRIVVQETDNSLDLFVSHELSVPKTLWSGGEFDAGNYGNTLLINMLGEKRFDFPKSINLVKKCISVMSPDDDSIVLDFFAGSGTTGHAVINLNREAQKEGNQGEGKGRKYVLCEMGAYFDTVLLPRLKKAVFTDAWKDGKPQTANGIKHLIQYHVLEQYEDTLSNVERPRSAEGDQALDLFSDDYLLRYWLDYETEGSPSLLSLPGLSEPSRYRLCVTQNGTLTETTIDLQTTFHYLLGLRVRLLREYRDGDRLYRASFGTQGDKRIAIIWRDFPDSDTTEANLAADRVFVEKTILPALLVGQGAYDRLFINGVFTVPGAESIEPEIARLMWEGEDA